MATCSVILPRLERIIVWREIPCCLRVLCYGSRICGIPALTIALSQYKALHTVPGPLAKNYLHKFMSKNKKKLWHDRSWYLPMEKKPSGLLALMKQQRSEKAKNNVRIKTLNGILYDALTSLLNTSEVSEEVYKSCIELSKVSVSPDFSVARAYWLSSSNKDTDDEIEKLLQQYAPRFRHLMISYHVLGNVPPVVFVRDKEDARRQEVEYLFSTLQFEEDKVSPVMVDVSSKLDTESLTKTTSVLQLPSIFGIDHAELNQQIIAYKKKMKGKVLGTDSNEHFQQQKEQLLAIRKQNLQMKKMKRQREKKYNMSPQDYLLANAVDSDENEELGFELHEDLVDSDEEEEPHGGST